ncbi:MAG: sigma-70 family RNA polymerase sigma factor [Acidobacteria bacterium]|nr:sigma-70 family RNA polymerase sigma factor [Acidobacteriota bacterium]
MLRSTGDLRGGFEREALPHLDAVYSFALRLTRRREDAHDLTQETFLRAFERFRGFTPGTNCKAWLFTITYSIFVNQYHRDRREPVFVGVDDRERSVPVSAPRERLTPARAVAEADIEEALAQLPEDFRSTVMLVDAEGVSYEEAAHVLSCPVGTVRSRLFRARKMLAAHLRDYDAAERRDP